MLIDWVPIKTYEGYYEINNIGEVRSVDRHILVPRGNTIVETFIRGKIMKLQENKKGYLAVDLCKGHKKRRFLVHRLVAQAFLGDFPSLQINHKDGNKKNNRVIINEDGAIDYEKTNIEWCTNDYNRKHSIENGLWKRPKCAGRKKVSIQAIKAGAETLHFNSIRECADYFNADVRNIRRCTTSNPKVKTYRGYTLKRV